MRSFCRRVPVEAMLRVRIRRRPGPVIRAVVVVVLGQLNLNPQFALPAPTDRVIPKQYIDHRRRITQPLRDEVVRRYVSENQTALEIAEECGIGKSTVLRILKTADVTVRRQGEKRN